MYAGRVFPMKVLLFTNATSLTGGNKRVIEVLRKARGVTDYVPVFDKKNFNKLVRSIESTDAVLKDYTPRLANLRPLPSGAPLFRERLYLATLKIGKEVARIASEEKIELIATAHEDEDQALIASIASRITGIPWTAVLQSTPVVRDLIVERRPRNTRETLSVLIENELLRMHNMDSFRALRRWARFRIASRILRGTLVLSVSKSIGRDMDLLDSGVHVQSLDPANGVDFEEIEKIKEPIENQYESVYFSRLIPEKGLYDVPRIWREVVNLKPDANLAVAGLPSGELFLSRFRQLTKEFGVQKNIHFLGPLSRKKLILLIKSSRCMIYPTRMDAFPLAVLEALACGKPVVAHNIPAINLGYRTPAVEKIPVGNYGRFGQTLVRLLTDDEEYKSKAKEASEFASRFTWENVVKEEAKAYRAVLDFWSSR
jgi:glycosyltransferase involved in cell wall biosynthesis